ncbi:MAG TPA: (2Fe-2S) ferredoxin domain-containing protein [Acetomicrobium flavidum]|uniref:(2Fe-2S) ferredoxin domain-containing protein n=1 Tax=Acetomicrobium flavidum TaxID=49896 RepID=UPI00059CAC93|nr:(2Fe-2S) ferredoxin domain-containing protein [Acetomicrobium mobile]NLG94406.1 (2Fe-2S) ferredoxin domain-containing protein [Acetomicrobium flavidum]HOJ82026.1 (2Fe-2S) ferredoxin domain-containing protein [Acetomicrobium flavidum]HOM30988.1 (2Fe-2S) ferredoxin domain-containing protein [Acetomicrobium flavidum]HOP87722.1 (2Fe-2S) ferredoxin domain-containing protein [Acetomicrobium flavidum]HPP13772.1 (2Fe-2S) ferredoxin domain-containing protein [Acetomicrobium flavidum]
MPKIRNLEDLRKLKEEAKDLTSARSGGKKKIIVGMGTCGIAAGAREVLTAILNELDKRGIKDVAVETTGCIGMCQYEPLVDIIRPGEPRVTYGNVKPEDVSRIIAEHLINGNIVWEKVIGRTD